MLSDNGMSIKSIAIFGIIGLPYSFKFLWAPFIDSIKIPFIPLSNRCAWIVLIKLLLVANVFIISCIDNIATNILATVSLFASLAFLSASLDVAIDGFRIAILDNKEQGLGNTFAVFGYRIGMLISGAGALYIADYFDWHTAYRTLMLFLLPGLVCAFLYKDKKTYLNTIKTSGIVSMFQTSIVDLIKIGGFVFIVLFVLFYRLNDAYIGLVLQVFYKELGFSKSEIASIIKVVGLFATILGTFLGGVLCAKFNNIKKSLIIALFFTSISNLLFILPLHFEKNLILVAFIIIIENISEGLGNIALVAFISILSNKKFAGTHYAILSSIAMLPRTLISSTSGAMVDTVGWEKFFIISSVLSLPSLIWLAFIKDTTTKRSTIN